MNIDNEVGFRSVVRRFLQNAASLTRLLTLSREEAAYYEDLKAVETRRAKEEAAHAQEITRKEQTKQEKMERV